MIKINTLIILNLLVVHFFSFVSATASNLESLDDAKKSYITVEKLKGPLAPLLEYELTDVTSSKFSNILLSSQGMNNLSLEEKEYVTSVFAKGYVVACLHPDNGVIQDLLKALLPMRSVLPEEDLSLVEIIAIKKQTPITKS